MIPVQPASMDDSERAAMDLLLPNGGVVLNPESWGAVHKRLDAIVSERDALAVRVRELEAERAGWKVINIGQRPAVCDGATSWSCCDTGRCEHDHDNARADASWREFDAALRDAPQQAEPYQLSVQACTDNILTRSGFYEAVARASKGTK